MLNDYANANDKMATKELAAANTQSSDLNLIGKMATVADCVGVSVCVKGKTILLLEIVESVRGKNVWLA